MSRQDRTLNIERRIERRIQRSGHHDLIDDAVYLSPLHHIENPVGRGATVEQVLNYLQPVFDGQLPPNAYLHGPPGSGKSAIVSVVFEYLARSLPAVDEQMPAATRSPSRIVPSFVYIDSRQTRSECAFYRHILERLTGESVPKHGVSIEAITDRLDSELADPTAGIVAALDHADEVEWANADAVVEHLRTLPARVSWLAVGRQDPYEASVTRSVSEVLSVERYRLETLADILVNRASRGLIQGAMDYSLAEYVASWADGDAHDGLAVLLAATADADEANQARLTRTNVESAIDRYPAATSPLGRVFALPENWQAILRELLALDPEQAQTVTSAAAALPRTASVDLSEATVERVLYELSDARIVDRHGDGTDDSTRDNGIVPRFPADAFRWLYDRRSSADGDSPVVPHRG